MAQKKGALQVLGHSMGADHFVSPSFQDGSGSCANAAGTPSAAATTAANIFITSVLNTCVSMSEWKVRQPVVVEETGAPFGAPALNLCDFLSALRGCLQV